MTNPFESSPFASADSESEVEETAENENEPEAAGESLTLEAGESLTLEEAPPVQQEEKKARKRTKPNNPRRTDEQIKFILKTYKDKQASELAKELGLTLAQVNKTVSDARKSFTEKAEQLPEEKKAEVLAWIEENLPSRKENFGRGAKKSNAIEDTFNECFPDLF